MRPISRWPAIGPRSAPCKPRSWRAAGPQKQNRLCDVTGGSCSLQPRSQSVGTSRLLDLGLDDVEMPTSVKENEPLLALG